MLIILLDKANGLEQQVPRLFNKCLTVVLISAPWAKAIHCWREWIKDTGELNIDCLEMLMSSDKETAQFIQSHHLGFNVPLLNKEQLS